METYLFGRLGPGKTDEGSTGQSTDGVRVRDRCLDVQQLQEGHDAVVGSYAVPHLVDEVLRPSGNGLFFRRSLRPLREGCGRWLDAAASRPCDWGADTVDDQV